MSKASDYLVALDDGHGENTAGKRTPHIASLGRQIRENEFNEPVVNLLEDELKRCGFRTLQIAPTDLDTPLNTRTNTANKAKANLLISVHFNAMGNTFGYSTAKGFSVHIQPEDKSNPRSGSLKFAKLAIEELAKGTAQTNRGVVGQNLHMTRESNMPAVLVECGFMDEEREALLMISKAFQKEVAQELARAVCRYFGVPYIAEKSPESISKPTPIVVSVVKEEIKLSEKLYKPSNDVILNDTATVLRRLENHEKDGLDAKWRLQLLNGELTESDAIGLIYTALRRGLIQGDGK
jgi:N-acetylmuramoyl-L-alanine amidase